MKDFWCVSTKFYDDGRIKSGICLYPIEADEKPKSKMIRNKNSDEYHDYFDTREEAEKFRQEMNNKMVHK